MPDKDLKTNYVSDQQHLLRGDTLNRMTAGINAGLGGFGGRPSINTVSKIDLPNEEFIFGVGVVVGASNVCPLNQDEGEFDAPCATVNKYVVRFRYYDNDLGIWQQYEDDLRLEAAVYYEPTDTLVSPPSSGPGYGAIPTYGYGDVVFGYFDPQRNWFIPISTPPSDPPMAEFAIRSFASAPQAIAINTAAEAGLVDCYLEVFRSRGLDNDWHPIASVSFDIPMAKSTYQSRSTFATIVMPAGSVVRLRGVRGPDPSGAQIHRGVTSAAIAKGSSTGAVDRYTVGTTSDSGVNDSITNEYGNIGSGKKVAYMEQGSMTIKLYEATLRMVGFGRRTSNLIGGAGVDFYNNGTVIGAWGAHASTTGRYKDSPFFATVLNGYAMGVNYLDPLDQWMIAMDLHVTINVIAENNTGYAISAECP